MRMRARTVAVIVTGLALGLALIPFASPHCPDWTVTVIDKRDQPIPGMTVRLSYQNHSAEDASHEVDGITDQRGQVTFSAQALHASCIRRCYYTLLSARAGIHASFGPSASVFAFGKGMEGSDVDPKSGTLVFWRGTPSQMQSRIVISRNSN
jgi:hypothetical protein